MAVVYDEGRTASITRTSVSVERVVRVTPYNEVPYVCDLILGGCRLIGGRLYRIPPSRDPQFPWCVAEAVEIEGVGAYTGTAASGLNNLAIRASYDQGCRLRITYKTPEAGQSTGDPRDGDLEDPPGAPSTPTGNPVEPTNQQEIDLASESYDWSYEYAALSGEKFGFSDGIGQTPDRTISSSSVRVGKRIPKIDMVLTRHFVVRAPWTAIGYMIGTVNKTAFRRGRVTWPKETMRFDGLQTSRKFTSFGLKWWELTLKFQILILKDQVAGGVAAKDHVGWLRMYDINSHLWRYVVGIPNQNKTLLEYDEDNYTENDSGIAGVAGFKALFHPRILV